MHQKNDQPARLCDMTAGFAVDGHDLCLEIIVPTASREEHERVAKAIEEAIIRCGYETDWIPSL